MHSSRIPPNLPKYIFATSAPLKFPRRGQGELAAQYLQAIHRHRANTLATLLQELELAALDEDLQDSN